MMPRIRDAIGPTRRAVSKPLPTRRAVSIPLPTRRAVSKPLPHFSAPRPHLQSSKHLPCPIAELLASFLPHPKNLLEAFPLPHMQRYKIPPAPYSLSYKHSPCPTR